MTYDKTWRTHPDGPLLGSTTIISPWTGGPTEAVVNTETNEVIAAHGATCQPFFMSMPPGSLGEVFKGELRDAPSQEPGRIVQMNLGDGTRLRISASENLMALTPCYRECKSCPSDGCDCEAPYALTEAHLPALERWIRARHHIILVDPATDAVRIVCVECREEDCKCVITF